jgi:hypothetical protein
MPEFEDLRARFLKADRDADAARKDARTAYIRAAGTDDPHLAAAARAARKKADDAARLRGEAFAGFEAFSDPRKGVGRLDDGVPLLLLPLRIETRFKTITNGLAGVPERHELWVRVYPDDWRSRPRSDSGARPGAPAASTPRPAPRGAASRARMARAAPPGSCRSSRR